MVKSYIKLCTLSCTLLLTACGTTSSETDTETSTYSIAKDNAVHDVKINLDGYRVEVHTDKVLKNEPSNMTKIVYGKVNGQALNLSINNNYEDGDVFVVKVFRGNELVEQSDEIVLDGDVLEFFDVGVLR